MHIIKSSYIFLQCTKEDFRCLRKYPNTEARNRVLLESDNGFVTCRDRDSLLDEGTTAFGGVVSLDPEDTMLLVRSYVDQRNTKYGWLVTGILQRACLALGTPSKAQKCAGVGERDRAGGMKYLRIPRQE